MLLISKYGNGSREFVNGLEGKPGIELDEEYRKFLVKYNGGDTGIPRYIGAVTGRKNLRQQDRFWNSYIPRVC